MNRLLPFLLILLGLPLSMLSQETGAPNLVANGDFSSGTDRWEAAGDPADVTQTLTVANDQAGKPYAILNCTRCERNGPASHAMLAQSGTVNLTKGRLYEFSCRVRAEGLSGGTVAFAIKDTTDGENAGWAGNLPVGRGWKVHRRLFTAARDVGATGRLQFWFHEPGALCVSDVRIVEMPPQPVEFTAVVPGVGGGRNLVPNGSFEVGTAGWGTLGAASGWGEIDALHGRIIAGAAPHGQSFLRIPLGGERTPTLYSDYFESTAQRELQPLAANQGWIRVDEGAAYTVSCDLRANRSGVQAILGVRAQDPESGEWTDYRRTVTLTESWKRHTFTFHPGYRYLFVSIGPDLAKDDGGDIDVDVDAVQLERGDQASSFAPRRPVELALEPSEPAGIFTAGQPATLLIRAAGHAAAPQNLRVQFQVTDFDGRPVALPEQTLAIPAGSTVVRTVPLPAEWRGFFTIRSPQIDAAPLRVAIVPARTADDSILGVNHAFATARLIGLAAKGGIGWYRDWSLKWQHIEPEPGRFHWEISDTQIGRVLREGARVLPLLPPFPATDWGSEAPPDLPTTGYPGVRLRQAWAPRVPDDLGAFVERAVSRYRDRIHVWEFLNEPIYTDYSLPADRGNKYGGRNYTPADYVALLRVAAARMRAADPDCRIIGGIGSGPEHLTREVIEAGCLQYVDIFNLHLYPGAKTPESHAPAMAKLLDLMDAHGGRKPIWITELAYYGVDDLPRRPFIPRTSSWAEERLLDSEQQSAEYTVRFFVVMLAHGVEKIFIHSGSSSKINEPSFECPLFDHGGAPRKLFPALAVLTETLGARPGFVGRRSFGETGHAVAFETGTGSVIVLWREEDGAKITLAFPAAPGWHGMDIMGRRLASGPVSLSPSPIYLLGPSGKARELLQNSLSVVQTDPAH